MLNELQQQAAEIHDLKELLVEMQAGPLKLQAKDQLIAQRLCPTVSASCRETVVTG